MTVEQIQALQARIQKYTVPDEVMEYQRRAEEINRATVNLGVHLTEQIQAVYRAVEPMLIHIRAVNRMIEPTLPHIVRGLQAYDVVVKNITHTLTPAMMQMSIAAREIISNIDPKLFECLHTWNSIKNVNLGQMLEALNETYPESLENENSFDVDDITLSEEEKIEIVKITEVIATQPQNWQIALVDWCNKWAARNPVIVKMLVHFILPLFIAIASGIIVTYAITSREAPLRTEPTSKAPIVINIIENQNIVIVNSVPYWHEIEYEDKVTGETYCGWVAKRSIEYDECQQEEMDSGLDREGNEQADSY